MRAKHRRRRAFPVRNARRGAHAAPQDAVALQTTPAFRLLVVFALVVGLLSFLSYAAYATDDDLEEEATEAAEAVDDAQLTLDEAEARMAELTEECEQLQAEIDEMQEQIDALAAAVLEAQSAKFAGRESLAEVVEYQYRNSSLVDVLAFLFDSESFSDLLRNIAYLQSIVEYFTDVVNEQQENIDTFQAISEALTAQKDEQEEKMAELEEKIAEAAALVEEAQASLEDAESEQDRIAELQAMAAELAASGELTEPVVVEEANTIDRQSVVSDDTPVIGDTVTTTDTSSTEDASDDSSADDASDDASEDSESAESSDEEASSDDSDTSSDSSDSSDSSSSSSSTGYQTGIASAYGGETDPYTPNPGITATGAVCDDYSMGVAVPMSWENYWEYYGRVVEITYNGITVYATVNDCGYMGGGTRVLDLQPGVWKAFGFTSCTEWGLRLVTYRFL